MTLQVRSRDLRLPPRLEHQRFSVLFTEAPRAPSRCSTCEQPRGGEPTAGLSGGHSTLRSPSPRAATLPTLAPLQLRPLSSWPTVSSVPCPAWAGLSRLDNWCLGRPIPEGTASAGSTNKGAPCLLSDPSCGPLAGCVLARQEPSVTDNEQMLPQDGAVFSNRMVSHEKRRRHFAQARKQNPSRHSKLRTKSFYISHITGN